MYTTLLRDRILKIQTDIAVGTIRNLSIYLGAKLRVMAKNHANEPIAHNVVENMCIVGIRISLSLIDISPIKLAVLDDIILIL